MPRDIQTASGVVLRNVPDDITDGGALDLATQRGLISPEEASQTLGDRQALQGPDTGGTGNEVLIGAGKFFADRIPGVDNSVAAPDTLAAAVGGALPAVLASFAVPGTIAAQGALAGGLEFAREGSDIGSAAQGAVLGGAGAGIGNLASRVISGIGRAAPGVKRTLGQRLDSPLLQRFESGISSGGGFDFLKRGVTKELNRAAAKSIGQNADNLSPQVLSKAADDIGSIFEALTPANQRIPIAAIRESLDTFAPGTVGARVNRVLGDADALPGQDLLALRSALVQRARALYGEAPAAADDLSFVIDDIDDIIAGEIGEDALPLLRVAREAWKNLKILEGAPTIRNTGNVSPRQLAGRLANERSGFGTTFTRDRGGVLPDTQRLFNITRDAGRLSDIVGDSGTATRVAALGLVGAVTGAVLEGDIEGALKGAAIGLTPALAGRANVGLANLALGEASELAVRAGGVAGGTLGRE